MKKVGFIFLILFSMILLIGCGGGSSDTSLNPINDVNNTINNSNGIVGTWYVNYENDSPVYASNANGYVDHLVINANGTYSNFEYGHEYEYTKKHYITSDYDADVTPGTWKKEGDIYYLNDGYATDECIYNKLEDTLTLKLTSQQYPGNDYLWITTYKRTHNGKYQGE